MRYLLFLIGIIMAIACGTGKENTTRPNIIFIMTDDHACQAISAYGSKLLQTPHIDELAQEGMLFQHAFVTNSICSPSRAVALTGKLSHLNGVRDNLDVFDSAQVTFPKILRQQGYQTALVGKWHLKSTPSGFDYWRVLPDQGDYYHPDMLTPDGKVKMQGYVTDVVTDLAIGWLDSLRDESKPFMLMYHHKAPHREWWPDLLDIESFQHGEIPEPATLYDTYVNRGTAAREAEMRIADHMALTMDNKIRPEILQNLNLDEFLSWYEQNYQRCYDRLTPTEKTRWDDIYGPINEDFSKNTPRGKELTYWKYQRYMQDYLSTIKSVDRNIGRLMEYLDSKGLAENTLVIYTSDQGFYLGEHGWFDKRFMYEPSFRTPLIIRYPGTIKPNSVNQALVQNLDFAPTILDAAGVDIPEDMQGMSLLPLFDGQPKPWRDALYYHYYEYPGIHMVKRHYGIRTGTHKLIHFYYDVDEWELYDLQSDPDELVNEYNNPAYAAIREALHQQLEQLRQQYQDQSDSLNQAFIRSDMERLKQ